MKCIICYQNVTKGSINIIYSIGSENDLVQKRWLAMKWTRLANDHEVSHH